MKVREKINLILESLLRNEQSNYTFSIKDKDIKTSNEFFTNELKKHGYDDMKDVPEDKAYQILCKIGKAWKEL